MGSVIRGTLVKSIAPVDDAPPAPDWFLVMLLKEIMRGKDRWVTLGKYIEGDPPKPQTPTSVDDSWQEYETFRRVARTNYAQQIIGACLDRTSVMSFRTAAETDEDGDAEARKLWDANNLDELFDLARADTFGYGVGYLLANPITKKAKHFRPWQAVVIADMADDPLVGLAIEHNAIEERDYAYLFMRDTDDNGVGTGSVQMHIAVRDRNNSLGMRKYGIGEKDLPLNTYLTQGWSWWKTEETGLDYIPLFEFPNRGKLGEFEVHTDILDRINYTLLQRVVIITMQAFKQRAIKGTFPKVDAQGNEIDYSKMFPSDPAALWLIPADAEMWESQQTSIQDILNATQDDVRDLCSVTSTPLGYATNDSANQSATGAGLQNDSYVFKIKDRKGRLGPRMRRFMSVLFTINGDEKRADLDKLRIIWDASENVSTQERYTSAVAARSAGISLRTVMREVLQYDADQISVAELEIISETLKNALATTTANGGGSTPLQANAAAQLSLASSNGATSRSTGASAGRTGQ